MDETTGSSIGRSIGPIQFQCIRIGSRLRVRIVTSGYNNNANCQFPRAIRVAGGMYEAPPSAITFSRGPAGKFFYRVKASEVTQISSGIETSSGATDTASLTVYGSDDDDCDICASVKKDVVFAPCGHYCCCSDCYKLLPTSPSGRYRCPMCRNDIERAVPHSEIQSII